MKQRLVHFISEHLPDTVPAVPMPPGAHCAFTGENLLAGVLLTRVIKSATSNLADTFTIASPYVSVQTAKCFKAQRLLRGNLFIDKNGIVAPMVSAKSALKYQRPTWKEVLLEFCQNPREALLILTEESKRRLWIDAALNTETRWHQHGMAFLNANDFTGTLSFSFSELLACLVHIQRVMRYGFSKESIRYDLYRQPKVVESVGLKVTRTLELKLRELREQTAEFNIALFAACKEDK